MGGYEEMVIASGACYATGRSLWRADIHDVEAGIEVLITREIDPSFTALALDVDRGKMYWGDGRLGYVRRANLDGSAVEDLIQVQVHDLDLYIPVPTD